MSSLSFSLQSKESPCQLPPPSFLLLRRWRLSTCCCFCRPSDWRRVDTGGGVQRHLLVLAGDDQYFSSFSVLVDFKGKVFSLVLCQCQSSARSVRDFFFNFWFRCFSVWLSFGGFRTGNNPVLTWETDLTALATAFADPSFADVNMTGVLVWTQLVVSIDFANCLPTIFHLFDLTHVIHFRTVCNCKSAIEVTATATLDSCPIHEKFLSCFFASVLQIQRFEQTSFKVHQCC